MGIKLKNPIKFNKDKTERAYAVLAMLCALAGGYKLLSQPAIHQRWNIPIWQFVGGILIFGVIYAIYDLTESR